MFDINGMLLRRLRELSHDIEQAVEHPNIDTVLTALREATSAYEQITAPAAQGGAPTA